MATAAVTQIHGIVKQIQSGDSLIIRDKPRGGPPQEWNCGLTNITAPKLARRPNMSSGGERLFSEVKDEPWAWEAREYLRKKLIGKEVLFHVETTHSISGGQKKFYGTLVDMNKENYNESLVREGLAEVRRANSTSDQYSTLCALEEDAKTAEKGKWSSENSQSHVRNVVWNLDNLRNFVDSHHQKPLPAIIDHIRDACTFRLMLHVKDVYYNVSFVLSGVKAPGFKVEDGETVSEPYAEEAKFFVEARLLQKSVNVVLETETGQSLVGSIIHSHGNIAEILLREGLSKCLDWSMGVVSQPDGASKLRLAEKEAKLNRIRLWKEYVPSVSRGHVAQNGISASTSMEGKVVEVGNADNLVVKQSDNGEYVKIFLSSIRPPRLQSTDTNQNQTGKQRPRPLYDIPYMFEAREFLRKKLIGKKVNVKVDFIQPKSAEYPEKICATVLVGDINVAEALVQKGLAYVVRYRPDDEHRSSSYDALLAAEAVAQKKSVGVHSKKEPPAHKVSDLAGDAARARQFLPSLQRSGRQEALVEYIAAANRFRLYIPRNTCLISFLLTGVECPRNSRRLPNGKTEPAEPFGEEACLFVKEICLQREVEVLIESCDKGGNFIGFVFCEHGGTANTNLSVSLVEHGFGKVHFSAEKTEYFGALSKAEDAARAAKLNYWSIDRTEEVKKTGGDEEVADSSEKDAQVTEVRPDMTFFIQYASDSDAANTVIASLNEELTNTPPVRGAYTPKKGELCAALFSSDNSWYRARVERTDGFVTFIDYGNQEVSQQLAALPHSFKESPPPLAKPCKLALCKLPPEEEDVTVAYEVFAKTVLNNPEVKVSKLFEQDGYSHVQLKSTNDKVDILEQLISDGYALVEPRRERRLAELIRGYQSKQREALRGRRNIWRYGDFQGEDEV